MNRSKNDALIEAYLFAKRLIIKHGYFSEIEWQDKRNYDNIRELDLINEAIWVIMSAGLSYKVVRKKFMAISDLFIKYDDLTSILHRKKYIRKKFITLFNNEKKMDAVFSFIEFLNNKGLSRFKNELMLRGVDYLLRLPYFGPATAQHFLKNIGISISKPDRHLTRISDLCGFDSVESLCSVIHNVTEEKKSVIDLVIWRYATIDKNYLYSIKNHLIKSNLIF